MNVELVDIDQIKPYSRNPRQNTRAVAAVAESLSEYGFQQPIVVDKDFVIIVGHTRYLAARSLNLTSVPVLVAASLTDEQVKAYRIADNKTNEFSRWDDTLLTGELKDLLTSTDLIDLSRLTQFSELEIDRLVNGLSYQNDLLGSQWPKDHEPKHSRVGLLVLKNSYVNRGVATYVNGWIEWGHRCGVQVDIISDSDQLYNNQFYKYENTTPWITPTKNIDDSELEPQDLEPGDTNDFALHAEQTPWITTDLSLGDDTVSMRSPIIRLNDTVKLRNSLIKALEERCYDLLILNTIDCLWAVTSIGLDRHHPRIYYATHSEMDVGRGQHKSLEDITRYSLAASEVKILSQSSYIADVFKGYNEVKQYDIAYFTPMLAQPELLEFNDPTKNRHILYIGPYEDRKAPEIFIRSCQQAGKPALVITPSRKSAEKFKKRFLQLGIEHEIHVALSGANKVKVMRQAALAIIPSKEETFCFTAYEASHVCRTILIKERAWTQAHDRWAIRVSEEDLAQAVQEHYQQPILPQHRQALIEEQQATDQQALALLRGTKTNQQYNNALTKWLAKQGTSSMKAFMLSRPSSVIDEIFYSQHLLDHSDYEFTHWPDRTEIRDLNHVDYTLNEQQIQGNLSDLLNLKESI